MLFPYPRRGSIRRSASLIGSLFAALAWSTGAPANEFTPEFRTLGLGQVAKDLPVEGYEAFACGSNGGPPTKQIGGWIDFMECPPDPRGLREVYVEFGRRTEQLAELFRDQYDGELWIQKFGGTRMANFPVVLSLLFDEEGVVRGFRAVTDTRAEVEDRGRAYLLRFRVFPLYGPGDWDCIDREPSPGESGVGDIYLNQTCTKTFEGKHVSVEARFLRKPGQTGLNAQGQFEPGQYESVTRWEVFYASSPE